MWNKIMPTVHRWVTEDAIMESQMLEWTWERAKLDVAIAEKRLELLEVGGV